MPQTLLNCHVVPYTECSGFYAPLDSNSGWSVFWIVRGDMIDFVVSAATMGWVGIGFSETPGMVSTYVSMMHTLTLLCIYTMANERWGTSCSHTYPYLTKTRPLRGNWMLQCQKNL